ncbi:MAG: AmmeMemoRadiSam system protein B [Kosmotoga sp.]|nr:MAG: AmmeMemoRadiSam system protein B [Kosmotoga sp.]
MRRSAVFAGKFYAGSKDELISQIESCFKSEIGPGKLPDKDEIKELRRSLGLISPHAGYMFSGPVAAHGFLMLCNYGKPKHVVMLGPNHSGYGSELSVWPEGEWKTPLGNVEVDEQLANEIIEGSGATLTGDTTAHLYEHCLEVQLPFLQYCFDNDFTIVPIVMTNQSKVAVEKIVKTLSSVVKEPGTLIIASSDLNHYEDHETTLRKGDMLVEEIKGRNVDNLYSTARKNRITACGLGPIAVVMSLFDEIEVLKHTTSAEASGDKFHTVGYLSALAK